MPRERVEDLGRICERIRQLLDEPLFEDKPYRNKEFLEWLEGQTPEKREDFLHGIPYQVSAVEERLYEMLEIAEGNDVLNRRDDL
jgi:hypothetical protein